MMPRGKKLKMPLIYLVLTTGLFLSIFPYLWMVLSSFKVSGEIFTRFWPSKLTLSNYAFIYKEVQVRKGILLVASLIV